MNRINQASFSIVTVVLNNLGGLKKTRESLLNQSYAAWKHIIIDGASSDGSEKFDFEILNDSKTTFFTEPDTGIYSAMNKGWKLAFPGTYIAFLNAGDVFTDSDSLKNAAMAIQLQHENLEWGCTTHEEIEIDGSGWVCKLVSTPTVQNQLYAYGYRSHQGVIMKKEFISKLGGFDEGYRIAADWDLIVRALLVTKPFLWREPLIRFEIGGFSSQRILQAHIELRSLREKYLWKSVRDRVFDDIYCAVILRSIGYQNYITKIGRMTRFLFLGFRAGSWARLVLNRTFSQSKVSLKKSSRARIAVRKVLNLMVAILNLPKYLYPYIVRTLYKQLHVSEIEKP